MINVGATSIVGSYDECTQNLITRLLLWSTVIALIVIINDRAHAQWYNYPYAPWRIQPGFRAPPVADPYIYARAKSYGLPPPAPGADVAPPLAFYDPAPLIGPQPLLIEAPPLG